MDNNFKKKFRKCSTVITLFMFMRTPTKRKHIVPRQQHLRWHRLQAGLTGWPEATVGL
jgi:hypothetical protein